MESHICFRILINRNFGEFEINISKCNRTSEQPGIYIACVISLVLNLETILLHVTYLHYKIIVFFCHKN